MRGGATSVVMPAAIGAIRIAQLAAQAQTDAEQLPEDRYRMLQRYEKRTDLAPQPLDEDELVQEVEYLAELAAETTHAEDAHILEEIAKANS